MKNTKTLLKKFKKKKKKTFKNPFTDEDNEMRMKALNKQTSGV